MIKNSLIPQLDIAVFKKLGLSTNYAEMRLPSRVVYSVQIIGYKGKLRD